jgi:hypothetical protein
MDYTYDKALKHLSDGVDATDSFIEEKYKEILVELLGEYDILSGKIGKCFVHHNLNSVVQKTILNILCCVYVIRPKADVDNADDDNRYSDGSLIPAFTHSLLTQYFFQRGLEAFPTLNRWSLFFDHSHWTSNWEEIREGAIKAATKVVGAHDPMLGVIFNSEEMKLLKKK